MGKIMVACFLLTHSVYADDIAAIFYGLYCDVSGLCAFCFYY